MDKRVEIAARIIWNTFSRQGGSFEHSEGLVVREVVDGCAHTILVAIDANAVTIEKDLMEEIAETIEYLESLSLSAAPLRALRLRTAAHNFLNRPTSTLARGDEIEKEFYCLKAQEWACEPDEAERRVVAALNREATSETHNR